MSEQNTSRFGRRAFLASGAAFLSAPAIAQTANTTEVERDLDEVVQRNISSFRALDWRGR